MHIIPNNSINFGRKPSYMADYYSTLKSAQQKAGNQGKNMLILPVTALPNETGSGNLATAEGRGFLDFAKQMWGINEVQLLPVGQYHKHKDHFPFYSGSSMDLGSHMINIIDFVPEEDYKSIVNANKETNRTNLENIIQRHSPQEKALRKLYDNITPDMKTEFEAFKKESGEILEQKGLYKALVKIYKDHDYKHWSDLDKNLFNTDLVSLEQRNARITEIHELEPKEIDFYKFKQFLAEKSLAKAKAELNANGLKLSADFICGYSYDEVWSHPKAFFGEKKMIFGLPAANYNSKEGKALLREKANFYAKHFDGFRVDAAWTYIKQPITNINFGDEVLNIIEDEAKKVKGKDYLNDITFEFAASADDFLIYEGHNLKPSVKDRIKIYTSDHLSPSWGSNQNYLQRGWEKEKFIIGATNHDSSVMKFNESQAKVLSEILKIPEEKLKNKNEFIKAKFAEPVSAYNTMIYIRDVLGSSEGYQTLKISNDYEQKYFDSLKRGEGFNPMDALEKSFRAKGLDKTESELYKKIVKYNKILTSSEKRNPALKYTAVAVCAVLLLCGAYKLFEKHQSTSSI